MERQAFDKLTEVERELVQFAINYFGTGQHPWASKNNLYFFQTEYVKECLQRVTQADIAATKFGVELAKEVLVKL